MDQPPLKTGILGLDHRGSFYWQVLRDMAQFKVCAVADRDVQRLEEIRQQEDCEVFDDARQFILQSDLDCLIVAAGLHSCLDHVRMALKKGIAVLKLSPAGRRYEEALELVELAESENVRFDIANPMRYCDSFKQLRKVVMDKDELARPFMVRLRCDFGLLAGRCLEDYQLHPDSETAWITDQELAGGGVLLHNCYGLLDQCVQLFCLPDQVYALCTSLASEQQQLHHLTEDAALVSLRLGEGLMGEVVAMRHWDDRPTQQTLTVNGKERIVSTSTDRHTVSDSRGQVIEQQRFDYDERLMAQRMLMDYAESFKEEDPSIFSSSGRDNLPLMALLEAAYLSVRTGSPEEPGRMLRM